MSLNIYWQFPKFTEVYWYIYENVSKYVGFVEAIYEIFSKYFFWHDVTLVLCWLMYRWSSADWCTAGPLLIYVLLVLCWLIHSTAGPLKCTTGPLLTDVRYSWSYADWCTAGPLLPDLQYCWSSAACCPASLPLTDAMCIIFTEMAWHIYWVFSKKQQMYWKVY